MDEAVEAAVMAAVQANRLEVLGLMLFDVRIDHIEYSDDGRIALVWLALSDPESGEMQGTEPALSIVRNLENRDPAQAASWSVTLPHTDGWQEQLNNLPAGLMTDELLLLQQEQPGDLQTAAVETFTGYKLPWVAGKKVRLTGSVAHFLDYKSCSETTCRYAYDFADGTMFPLMASKGGTVKAFYDGYENGNTSSTNYLVIEDQSTVPTTYQLYYHIAKNSVRVRTIGQVVRQGDYVADTDDTGASTAHHLHFHVYKTPSNSGYWGWGASVRILFTDVHFNGGEPRKCYETTNWPAYGTECLVGPDGKKHTSDDDWLVSENTPAHPPSASLSAPVNRKIVTTTGVLVSGTAVDDLSIERIQVQGNWDGVWRSIGDLNKPGSNGAFSQELNLCNANVPDGPLSLKVVVYDREGSMVTAQPGPVQIVKNFFCGVNAVPSQTCQPTSNQVAIFNQPNFTGDCKRLSIRDTGYSGSELVGDNQVASVLVGANVQAVLYDLAADMSQTRPEGRIETLESSDVNLADNRLDSGRVSGVVVQSRSTSTPDEPFLKPVGDRWDGSGLGSSDSLILSWEGGSGDTYFNVNLKGPGLPAEGQSWNGLKVTNLSIGTRPPGTYTWTVVGTNTLGSNTSDTGTFTVASSPLSGSPIAPPFNDAMEGGENGWQKSGLWRLGTVTAGQREQTNAWVYNNEPDYASSTWRAGDLTSPPITLPAGPAYYLRFKYYAGVENANADWDQRRVQVLNAAGDYLGELYQFTDDRLLPDQWWIDSPPLSLAPYAGQTVRLRFHFNTIDEDYNNGLGWMIDDVSVTDQGLPAGCLADGDFKHPALAQVISIGSTVQADLCPQGDVDYFSFNGTAGQPIRINIDARTLNPASALDSQVYLLDTDGRSVVAWNDDEVLYDKPDSLLVFTLRRTGTYFIKVKAWDSPAAGGLNFPYSLRLEQVPNTKPLSINLVSPADSTRIPVSPFEMVVQAADYDGGPVAQVDFYWHSSDWAAGSWVKVGSDTNGSDGWTYIVHPQLYGGIEGGALYVQAKNAAGAALGLVVWDLKPDPTTMSRKVYIPLLSR